MLLLTGAIGSAGADIIVATPDRLEFAYSATVAMPKAQLWARVLKPGTWWSDQHTYSGKAANMKLTPKAGGCWCEVWPGGEVQHGHILYIAPGSALRLDSALGPLQEMAVAGVLAITLEPGADPGHTKLNLTYKVSGASTLKLDAMSHVIDRVIGEQFAMLSKAP
jgi:uncharacterized protein YndB with AHSA1/START domain